LYVSSCFTTGLEELEEELDVELNGGFGADTEVDTGGGRAGVGFSNPSCVHLPPK